MQGDGGTPPAPAGYVPPSLPGVAAGAFAGIFRGRQVVISGVGPGSGLFVYNGTPGPGNPPVFSVVAPGTTQDPFGNGISAIVEIGQQSGGHWHWDSSGNLDINNTSSALIATWRPTDQALLIYQPGGGTGKLVTSVASVAGTDQFGNAYLAGVQVYGAGGAYAQLVSGALNFLSGSTEFQAGQILASSAGLVGITSGLITGADTAASMVVASQASSGITGGALQMSAGQVILPSGGGPFVLNEFWNQAVISNANNSGNNVNGLFYRLSCDNTVHVIWDITPTAAAGSVMFTLPSQYRPTHQQTVESGWYGTGPAAYSSTFAPRLQVAVAGGVSYQGTNNITSGMNLCGSWKFSTTVN